MNIDLIFKAALSTFADFGYKKTTMDDIASKLNVTKATLYIYFKDKQDLYNKCLYNEMTAWQNKVREEVMHEADTKKMFVKLCKKSIEYFGERKELVQIIKRDPNFMGLSFQLKETNLLIDTSVKMLKHILDAGIEKGEFTNRDSSKLAEILYAMFEIILFKAFIADTPSYSKNNDIESLIDIAIDLVTQGLFVRE